MTKKLTLIIDKSTLQKAEVYAKNTDRSLSELIVDYLEELPAEHAYNIQLSPKLQRIAGIVKLPVDFNEEKS